MPDCWYGPERDRKKPGWSLVMITFPKGGAGEVLHPSSFPSSAGRARQRDMILKHFLIKIERSTLSFLCLEAVNYLTSTHNEQCKTSQNLIKRQRRVPGTDGKWLTQLIKHPSVRLNMATLSHHQRKRWELLCITIFPFPLAHPTFITFIMLTLVYSAALTKTSTFTARSSLIHFPSLD